MKDGFKMGRVKNKFSLGLVTGIILALVIMSAATAMGDVLKSWRTDSGVVVQKPANDFLELGSQPTVSTKCGPIAPAGKLRDVIRGYDMGDPMATANMPLIIDVRPYNEYYAGHIPHAVWIANWNDMAKPENLDILDKALADHITSKCQNDKIVVYCHTGHRGGFVAAMLGALGYNAHNMKYGFKLGWQGNTGLQAPLSSFTTPTGRPVNGPLNSFDRAVDTGQYIYTGILDGGIYTDPNGVTYNAAKGPILTGAQENLNLSNQNPNPSEIHQETVDSDFDFNGQ